MAIRISEDGTVIYDNEPDVNRELFPNLPGGYASTEQISQAVDEWLEDHPEATTTVTDGSITRAKLDSELNSYLNSVGADISSLNEDITNLQTGKQDALTFDQTPTVESANPVTSGGVKLALDSVDTEIGELKNELDEIYECVVPEGSSWN